VANPATVKTRAAGHAGQKEQEESKLQRE